MRAKECGLTAALQRVFYRSNVALVRRSLHGLAERRFPLARQCIGLMAVRTGLLLNLSLAVGKILSGLLCASISLLGDGINNLSDGLGSLLTLLAFTIAAKRPDKEHPYGHARIEYLTGTVLALFVVIAAIELGISSLRKLLQGAEMPDPNLISLLFMLLAIAAKLWLSQFYGFLGSTLRADMLVTQSLDARADALSTSVIVIGLVISCLSGLNLDAFLGFGLALYVFKGALDVLRDTIDKILGGLPAPAFVEHIESFLESRPEILSYHDLQIHDYGPGRVFVTVDAEVNGAEDVITLHDAIDRSEREGEKALAAHFTIHMDPRHPRTAQEAAAEASLKEILQKLATGLSYHDLMFRAPEENPNMEVDVLVPLTEARSDEELQAAIERALVAKDPKLHPLVHAERNFFAQI